MGSIESYVTKAGKRYRVRYRKPDHSQAAKRGFVTKKAAELYLAENEVSKARGEWIDASEARVTVFTLGKAWLASQTHLKASSLRPVEIAWRLYVEPFWGRVSIGDVRHSDVQAWVSSLTIGSTSTAGKGPTTVLRAYGVLAAILDAAVKDRRLLSNPARGVTLPRKTGKARVYLSHDQVQLLADHAGKHSTLVLLLAYTGLRWGEATGLRIKHLDVARKRVRVQENAVNVGGRVIVGTPKSHEARSVPFPAFLTDSLALQCIGKSHGALIFGNGLVHQAHPDGRRGWFVSAVAKAQLVDETFPRVTIHDLRHTAASLAVSSGANVKAVQRMLGHASAAMTLDTYADLFEDDLDAVSEALDKAKRVSDVSNSRPNAEVRNDKTP